MRRVMGTLSRHCIRRLHMRSLVLWLVGVPISVIVLLNIFNVI
jgi:hypothetical protein